MPFGMNLNFFRTYLREIKLIYFMFQRHAELLY